MSEGPPVVEVASLLHAPAATVWAHATRFGGVNAELRPWLRMTVPRDRRHLDLSEVVLGERAFRSWLLALGAIPVEYDDLTLVEVDPGRRFLERSRMWGATLWEHERVVVPVDATSCRLTDRVSFRARWPATGVVLRFVVPRLFEHRHRRLRSMFGARPG